MKSSQEVGKKIKMNMPTTKKWSRPTMAITTACRYSCDACGMRFGQLKCIEAIDKPIFDSFVYAHFRFVDEQASVGKGAMDCLGRSITGREQWFAGAFAVFVVVQM
jgi:hypothetical protein